VQSRDTGTKSDVAPWFRPETDDWLAGIGFKAGECGLASSATFVATNLFSPLLLNQPIFTNTMSSLTNSAAVKGNPSCAAWGNLSLHSIHVAYTD
jgi:hypothetical protein